VILGDVNIGNNVTIGAGSVITKDVEDNSVMVGNAATVLKKKYIISVEKT
jgi:serine acetyltransferase